jgi:hypothetical protein
MVADHSFLVATTAGFERYWQPESDLAPKFKPLLDESVIAMSDDYFRNVKRVQISFTHLWIFKGKDINYFRLDPLPSRAMEGGAQYYLIKVDTTGLHKPAKIEEFGQGYSSLIESNRHARTFHTDSKHYTFTIDDTALIRR